MTQAVVAKEVAQWPWLATWVRQKEMQPPMLVSANAPEALVWVEQQLQLLAVCEQPQGEFGCTTCAACRSSSHGVHPDVLVLPPEDDTITIDQVRLLLDKLSRAPLTPRRLVLLRRAETLGAPAANALLKSLEEPGQTTRIVLTTQWPGRMLPTIRSRCQLLRLVVPGPPAASSTVELPGLTNLTKKEPLDEEQLAALSQALLRLARQDGGQKMRLPLQRLRDYYVMTSQQGNERLARDVLLASLPALD